jgi:hypothetical protein
MHAYLMHLYAIRIIVRESSYSDSRTGKHYGRIYFNTRAIPILNYSIISKTVTSNLGDFLTFCSLTGVLPTGRRQEQEAIQEQSREGQPFRLPSPWKG